MPDPHSQDRGIGFAKCLHGLTQTLTRKFTSMKPFFAFAAVGMCLIMNSGCSEHSTATKKEEITTPGGKTTITTQQDVKKTGDHKDK